MPKYKTPTKAELRKLIRPYLKIPGVTDVEIGDKYIDGKHQDILSIRFHVEKKVSSHDLHKDLLIPKKIGPYPTDVLQRNVIHDAKCSAPIAPIRPLVGGIEIQNDTLFAGGNNIGTMGGIIMFEGAPYGVTNFHVIFGDMSDQEAEEYLECRIYQPARVHGGAKIGHPSLFFDRSLDYCLIEFIPTVSCDSEQDINCITGIITGFSKASNQLKVFKSGTTTGVTHGIIEGESLINPTVSIRPDPDKPASGRISAKGDSGSFWVFNEASGEIRAVALHTGTDLESGMVQATSFQSIWLSMKKLFRDIHIPT